MSKLQGPKNGDAQSCALPTRNNNVSSADTCNAATQTEKVLFLHAIAQSLAPYVFILSVSMIVNNRYCFAFRDSLLLLMLSYRRALKKEIV